MENVIKGYLKEHMNEPMGDVLQGLEGTLQSCIGDRRFKMERLNVISKWSGPSWGGLFYFQGVLYYFAIIQPWAMCPNGKVTAGKMD